MVLYYSCERELSDDVTLSTFPSTAEIFTDAPVGLGSDFYFPFADSKLDAFSVDNFNFSFLECQQYTLNIITITRDIENPMSLMSL